jgi:hypothetical protein
MNGMEDTVGLQVREYSSRGISAASTKERRIAVARQAGRIGKGRALRKYAPRVTGGFARANTESFVLLRWLVDVRGIEPLTPCLQSKPGNTMWLILLAFTYVT